MNFTRTKGSREKGYTIIDSTPARDRRLSLKAKGFLFTIMALPDDWDFSVTGMASIMPEGRTAVYNVIDELIKTGYCTRTAIREKGRFVAWKYHFNEQPSTLEPLSGFPEMDKPDMENRPQLNTNLNNYLSNIVPDNAPDGATAQVETQARTKRAKSNKSALPTDFSLSENLRAWAARETPDIDLELEFANFCDKAVASEWKYAAWDAAFRTWCRNAKKWAKSANTVIKSNGIVQHNAPTVSASKFR